jgi:hypothetical protein
LPTSDEKPPIATVVRIISLTYSKQAVSAAPYSILSSFIALAD